MFSVPIVTNRASLPKTESIPWTRVFHAKMGESQETQNTAVTLSMRRVTRSIFQVPLLTLWSNYCGERFPCKSHFCLKKYFPSFIYSFHKHFLNASSVAGTILGNKGKAMKKENKDLYPHNVMFNMGERGNR